MPDSDVDAVGEVSRQNVETLVAKLGDPTTAAALLDLIDVLPTLSGSLQILNGLFASSEHILENVRDNITEIKTMAESPSALHAREQVTKVGKQTLPLLEEVADRELLAKISDPAVLGLISAVLDAITVASAEAAGNNHRITPITVIAALRDHDVSRGMNFVLSLLKSLGAALGQSDGNSPSTEKVK